MFQLSRGNNTTRGTTRGQSSSRSRGSRGKGSTSRGASSSSSSVSTDPFDQERLENAAKREQRGGLQNGIMTNGRGARGGRGGFPSAKSVRFASPDSSGSSDHSMTTTGGSNPFGAPSASAFSKPFAAGTASPFGSTNSSLSSNPFGSTASLASSNPFGSTTSPASSNPFATSGAFGTPSPSAVSPFGVKATSSQNSNPFGTIALGSSNNTKNTPSAFGAPTSRSYNGFHQATEDTTSKNDIKQFLDSQGILPPAWPQDPGNPSQKSAMENVYHAHKKYQAKARISLRKAGKIDDPDVPKGLDDAIAFNGTCEDMCPEFEKITRIVEHNVPGPEKVTNSDGSRWPSPEKMVKAMARSAAGQEPALPEEVRTPAALRRTLDYLMHTVLGDDGDLRKVHGYLWDRTRGIRRDFTFQVASLDPSDLHHYIYCLEGITRFHAIALHQMSKVPEPGAGEEGFVEQQEVEQLGKTLKSLVEAYDDCKTWGIKCDNEHEFRAYYLVHNSHAPNTLEQVQDWGYPCYQSEAIRDAVHIVETLQNIWDPQGPLNPFSPTDIASNNFSAFFAIVRARSTSYTMACLLETKFNAVRMAALKTILAAYRKQREQTKDWTLPELNRYLCFDTDEEIITFCEAYNLRFEEVNGGLCLSMDSDIITAPFPQFKQSHSITLVEKKRGNYTIPQAIDQTVFDETPDSEESDSDTFSDGGNALFVGDTPSVTSSQANSLDVSKLQDNAFSKSPSLGAQTSASLFDRIATPSAPSTASSVFQSPFGLPNEQTSKPKASSIFEQNPPTASFSDIFKSAAPSKISSTPSQDFTSIFKPKAVAESTLAPSFSDLPNATTKQALPSSQFGTVTTATPFGGTVLATPIQTEQTTLPPTGFVFPSLGASPAELPNVNSQVEKATVPSPEATLSQGGPPLSSSPPVQVPANVSVPSLLSPGPPILPGDVKSAKSSIQSPTMNTSNNQPVNAFKAENAPTLSKEERWDNFTEWYTLGDGGIIDQFTEHGIGEILKLTIEYHKKDLKKRKAKAEAVRAREEADQFRRQSLATKYCQMWRENAHRLWLKRQGRAARKARREMAESQFRASQAAKPADIVEDFRESASHKRGTADLERCSGITAEHPVKKRRSMDNGDLKVSTSKKLSNSDGQITNPAASKRRRSSLESLLHVTGVLDGIHDLNDHIRQIVHEEHSACVHKRRKSTRSTNSSSMSSVKLRSADDPLRRSILSDSTYLQGGSRIHLMENYGLDDERRRQPSGVQTDYFRLKARGITTMPNGTPLASSVARDFLRSKRSLEELRQPTTPQPMRQQPMARSVPSKSATSLDKDADIQALKTRAKAIMARDKESRLEKRSMIGTDEGEEELFAKARKIREQMDEGAQWYRNEIERSRSTS